MKLLDGQATLSMHGANLEFQSKSFQRDFRALLEGTSASVSLTGAYERSAVPRLMANIDWVVVPSIWWENSPLVIQEAFFHGRPVICTCVGAEFFPPSGEIQCLFRAARSYQHGHPFVPRGRHNRPRSASRSRNQPRTIAPQLLRNITHASHIRVVTH